ncbi:MAG TPA: hypothetical protein VG010_04365, partial [Solirubrobacteraceae bacterium]|nr:hypothetical protein [Solirubrobacteraceae bacterium]
ATTAALLGPVGTSGILGSTEPLPILDHLKLHLLASKSSVHKRKAKVTFTLSSAARVQIVIYRRVISHRCPRRAHSCVRYLLTSTKLTVNGHAGSNQFTIDLTRLSRGDYRLSATPVVPRGVAAALTRVVSFTVH